MFGYCHYHQSDHVYYGIYKHMLYFFLEYSLIMHRLLWKRGHIIKNILNSYLAFYFLKFYLIRCI